MGEHIADAFRVRSGLDARSTLGSRYNFAAHLIESQIERFVVAGAMSVDAVEVQKEVLDEQDRCDSVPQDVYQLLDGQPAAWVNVGRLRHD